MLMWLHFALKLAHQVILYCLEEDCQAEWEKRAEERFQRAVEGLSGEREEAQVGAVITMRTFLRPRYEQFYQPIFDLAVAHLRFPRIAQTPKKRIEDFPLTTMGQVLMMVFKEAFVLARSQDGRKPQALDASGVHLDDGRLREADFTHAWMPWASLLRVDLRKAQLWEANQRDADFRQANLRGTDLRRADLVGAWLYGADVRGASLEQANLAYADVREVKLEGANLSEADFFRRI